MTKVLKLGLYVYKKVKIRTLDGEIFIGDVTEVESKFDHEEHPSDSIDIDTVDGKAYTLFEDEIADIEVLEDDGTFDKLFGKH